MNVRKLFTTKMFLILLFPALVMALFLLLFLLTQNSIETYGVNKTVGWAYDLTNLYFLAFPLYIVYLFIYGLLFLSKIRTNYVFSVLHFTMLVIGFMHFDNYFFNYIKVFAIVISLVFFVINLILSFVNRKKLNRL